MSEKTITKREVTAFETMLSRLQRRHVEQHGWRATHDALAAHGGPGPARVSDAGIGDVAYHDRGKALNERLFELFPETVEHAASVASGGPLEPIDALSDLQLVLVWCRICGVMSRAPAADRDTVVRFHRRFVERLHAALG